ncbi:unnamed protein product, partial [Mesorhabditis belari]|uniref:Uncharacterized protein n=1 Tax=Mesorhabditis belari TaxID=2138241 RepID=A0AAF3F0M6_9BILA
MTAETLTTTKTPDYDPKRNSNCINFLLRGIDGRFKKEKSLCSLAESSLYSTQITLGEFPLSTDRGRRIAGIVTILLGLIVVAFVILAIFTSIPLWVTIPLAFVSFLFSAFAGLIYFQAPEMQHRYVQIDLNCKNCEDGHKVLYDAITKQKRRRYGVYTNPLCKTLQTTTDKRSYEFIDKAFEDMRSELDMNPLGYNCKHWADELYMKIA